MARNADGGELKVERPKDNRWRIATGGATEAVASYALSCKRGSVTGNQIEPGFAVFCGPATWIGEVGAGRG